MRPVREVPLDDRDLEQVAAGIGLGEAVLDARLVLERLGDDLPLDEADHAGRAALPRDAEVVHGHRLDVHGRLHPLRHLDARDLLHRLARLEDELGLEALEVGQEEGVGLVAGRERAELGEAVPEAGVERGHDERVLRRDVPWATASRTIELTWPVLGDVFGLAVVGAESEAMRPELLDQRQERGEVACGRGLADQHPEPGPQALAALLGREALVVGADAGRRVGLQLLAEDAGRVAVDVGGRERELLQLVRVAGDDAGEVHHLSEADHASATEKALEIAGVQGAARRLEGRGGHAGRGHEEDIERHLVAEVGEPVDAVRAEDVGDLVRVGDDRGRAEREDEARELVHEELRGLQVHVRVHEAGDDVLAARVDDLAAGVLAEAGDEAVADRHVGLQPFPREDREDLAALDDDVGELVAARHRDASREIRHGGTVSR